MEQQNTQGPLVVLQPPSPGVYVAGLLVRKLWRKHADKARANSPDGRNPAAMGTGDRPRS